MEGGTCILILESSLDIILYWHCQYNIISKDDKHYIVTFLSLAPMWFNIVALDL